MSTAARRDILISGVQFDRELRSGKISVLELAPIALRHGLAGVEYREVYWHDKATELPALREQLARLGLKAVYATFNTLFSRDPEKQKLLVQDLEDAHALGAPFMRVFRGERPTASPADASMRDAAKALVERAASYGMRLALENYSGIPGSRPEEILEALEILDSPVVGVNIDFANFAGHGIDPIEAIERLAPWIIYTHLKDHRPTADGKAVNSYLGSGNLPLPAILESLEATGRNFPYCFEFLGEDDPEGSIAKSIAYLSGLGLGSRG
ncbi:MAG: sugar phosphate isomerase/epimerase family protein [Sphingomonadaceae bacterium]